MAVKKYVVVHPKLNLAVKGKLQRVEVGTVLTLTDEQAKSLGAKVKLQGETKTLNLAKEAAKPEAGTA